MIVVKDLMRTFSMPYITDWLSRLGAVLKHKSGSGQTQADRSRERYRRAALATIAAGMSKIITLAASLIAVALTFRYLGAERYGMWVTISSTVALFTFADLGINNGLVTMIADAIGRDDHEAARRASASAFWMLSMVAGCLILLALIAYPFLNAARLFNVHSELAIRESSPSLLVFFICFALNLPLGVVRGVQYGLQKQFLNNLWTIFGSLASLISLLIAIHFKAGLPILVLCLTGAPVLGVLINGVELFGFSHPELSPKPEYLSRQTARRLLGAGVLFFVMQIAWAIGVQTDNVVIAQILGAKMVASYAVPARLFSLVPSFLVMVSAPMWPAYADAIARSDGPWVNRTFLRVVIVGTTASAALTAIFVLFGNQIIKIWVGPQIHASGGLLIALGFLSIMYAYLHPITFLLNGAGELKVPTVTGVISAIVNIVLSIILVRHYGIIGAVLGTIVGFLVQVVPASIMTRIVLRRLNRASV
jgi:O-antigen/teichoic acid export membrane protein